jgi:3'(2'), 5'-bisphosphate nucleotidase
VRDGDLCLAVTAVLEQAGKAAMAIYAGAIQVAEKNDRSPVTEADLRVHEILVNQLPSIASIPVLSEESKEDIGPLDGDFWLVDPLDGTKEFIKRTGEFTLNVALVRDGSPVVGVVHAPAIEHTWLAARDFGAHLSIAGAERVPIRPRVPAASPLRVAVSRDHVSDQDRALLASLEKVETIPMGSSLKFCRVASGEADLYVRFGRTMEWDTAAAQCVVECAGGRVVDLTGNPLVCGKPERDNPSFLCFADPELERVVGLAAKVGTR